MWKVDCGMRNGNHAADAPDQYHPPRLRNSSSFRIPRSDFRIHSAFRVPNSEFISHSAFRNYTIRLMRLAVLYNPAAGRGRARLHVGEAEGMLRAAGAEVLHYESKSREHMIEMARQLTPENCDRAVVCGGDGSVHLALRGLDLRIPLAVLPLGSGDDFAKTVGISPRLDLACDTVVNGVVREIDVGVANGLRFIGVAGVGFDSVVAARANKVKYLRGSLVYFYSIFSVLPSFRPLRMNISIDGVAET